MWEGWRECIQNVCQLTAGLFHSPFARERPSAHISLLLCLYEWTGKIFQGISEKPVANLPCDESGTILGVAEQGRVLCHLMLLWGKNLFSMGKPSALL